METSKNPRYYFDLRKERKNAADKGESAYTPASGRAGHCRTWRGTRLHCRGRRAAILKKGRIALIDNAQVNAAQRARALGVAGR